MEPILTTDSLIPESNPTFGTADKYVSRIVLQPTTLCNLNCSYCYLAHRKSNFTMPVAIAQAVASEFKEVKGPITVIWHGGEPLVTGRSHFERLLEAFSDVNVRHAIQTNATLIDDEWCELFKKYSISIGISVDGPGRFNSHRADFGGKETLSKVENGIKLLHKHNIKFGIIAVVNNGNIHNAREIYDYAIELGAQSLAINIEEIDGINTRVVPDGECVTEFWSDLWALWNERPVIRVREFDHIGKWINSSFANKTTNENRLDLFPTIAWNGDVVLFSPELHSLKAEKYGDFVVGNVAKRPLLKLLEDFCSIGSTYADEYLEGINMCKKDCAYFDYCKGGQASNKYAEHQHFLVTETISCRNSKKRLLNAVLEIDVDLSSCKEVGSIVLDKIKISSELRNLYSDQFTYGESSKSKCSFNNSDNGKKWDDFDKITFLEYDDEGNATGATVGGH